MLEQGGVNMAALNQAFRDTTSEKNIGMWIEKKIEDHLEKYEEDLEIVENKVDTLSGIVFAQSLNREIKRKRDTVEFHTTLEKATYAIAEMEDVGDIREQIQCVTRLLYQLNVLRQLLSTDSEKRKLVAFLYSVLKKNCDDAIFGKVQLDVFRDILRVLDEEKKRKIYIML